MKIKIVTLISVLALFAWTSNAQEKGAVLRAHIVMPQGDFADDDVEDIHSGLAATGLGAGFEFFSSFPESDFGWFVQIDGFYNGVNKDVKDDEEDMWSEELDNADFEWAVYMNVPIMAGVRYQAAVGEKASLFGKFGLGPDILLSSSRTVEGKEKGSGADYSASEEFDGSTVLGLTMGAGAILNQRIVLGLNYYGLGEHKLSGDWEESYDGDKETGKIEDPRKVKINVLTVSVGFKF